MQILLDIPDTEIPIERAMDTITLSFENGHVCKCNYPFKELPKGHGRLIDANEIEQLRFKGGSYIWIVDKVLKALTIIEADKEVEDIL